MTTGSMHGKRCVLTGATSGIGAATAVALAKAGAELTLVCRSRTRADATCDAIRRAAPDARVDLVLADHVLDRGFLAAEVDLQVAQLLHIGPGRLQGDPEAFANPVKGRRQALIERPFGIDRMNDVNDTLRHRPLAPDVLSLSASIACDGRASWSSLGIAVAVRRA